MKIAIVGCGAMGSIYAVLLSASGNNVTAIGRSEQRAARVRPAFDAKLDELYAMPRNPRSSTPFATSWRRFARRNRCPISSL